VLTVPGQVVETESLTLPAGVADPAGALTLANDLLSETVQRRMVEDFGAASARTAVQPPAAYAAWFAAPAATDPDARARPVGRLSDAIQARLVGESPDFAGR
jgi:ABC-type uncharacterized transport system YnjBCD substrate-binding protein